MQYLPSDKTDRKAGHAVDNPFSGNQATFASESDQERGGTPSGAQVSGLPAVDRWSSGHCPGQSKTSERSNPTDYPPEPGSEYGNGHSGIKRILDWLDDVLSLRAMPEALKASGSMAEAKATVLSPEAE